MSPNSSAPIFIHSLWRAGSTYLFQVFRRSEAKYYCYQEPLNEATLFCKNSPEKLLEYTGASMLPLRHPKLSLPYFQELYAIYPAWLAHISKPDIYDNYFSDICSEKLSSFYGSLIEQSTGRTVIQECRTSNRIGAIKNSFGGIHIYLWRNPWDQWWSFKATDYFNMVQLLLLNASNAHPVIETLRQIFNFKEYHSDSLENEIEFFFKSRLSAKDSYCCFYAFWCLALLEAQQHADFLLNIDQLSGSSVYKAEFLEIMGGTGISGLDFSDCRIHCTQFTQQDAAFFKPLEDMVHELLLQYLGSGQVDAIKEAREKGMPESQKVLPESAAENVVLEDARRTREVVIRLETAFNSRMQQQLLLQEQLQQKISQQVEQQTAMEEQLRSDLKRQYDEHEKHLVLQYTDEKQAFNNLLKKYQEKAQSEAQLRIEQVAALDKQHNQEIAELQKAIKQKRELLQEQLEAQARSAHNENEFSQRLHALRQLLEQEKQEIRQQFTEQLLTAEQQHFAREKELLHEQLVMEVRSTEREREFSEQLKFADQQKQELNQRFADQLLMAAQQHADREKELLHDQLVMQVRGAEREREFSNQLESIHRLADQEKQELNQQFLVMQARSTEREREVVEQLQSLHASYRQAEVAKEKHFQYLLNQISDEATVLYNSRWWRVGAFFGCLPKTGFERLSTLLTAGKLSLVTNNMPFSSSEFAHRDDTVVEEESLLEMDTIDQLLLSSETEFVTKAYQLILGRQADPTGIAHYRKWLRAGKSRVEILADLLASREAQLANRPGLDDLRVLIRQTGAGLKGWRKWFVLPRIISHRMAVSDRQMASLLHNANALSSRVQAFYGELATIKGALVKVEAQLSEQLDLLHLGQVQSLYKNCKITTTKASEPLVGCITVLESNPIFTVGEHTTLTVEVENQSDVIWETTADQPVFLSYHWFFEDGRKYLYDNPRTALSGPSAPGESRRTMVAVQPPEESGNYLLEITMVMEGQYWFEERGLSTSRILVHVHFPKLSPHAKRIHGDLSSAVIKTKMEAD
jgi:hypothetical protein